MSRKVDTRISLEMLGLKPSVNPMSASFTDEWFEYPGYFRSKAHCQLDVFTRGGGEKYMVAIVTELPENDGLSVTNAIEYIAAVIAKKFNLQPKDLVLFDHWHKDAILDEHWSFVRFKSTEHTRDGWKFHEPEWFHIERSELDRLIGIEEDLSWVDE